MAGSFQVMSKHWTQLDQVKKLVALIPVYLQGCGDATRCVFEDEGGGQQDGERYDMRPIAAVIEDLVCAFGINRRALARVLSGYTGRHRNLPIALNKHLILVPYKARQAQVKGDAVTGYFILNEFHHAVKDADKCSVSWVHLRNGEKLKSYRNLTAVNESVTYARLLAYLFDEKQKLGARNQNQEQFLLEAWSPYHDNT